MPFKTYFDKLILLLVILLAAFFHFESMQEYPMYIHAWAQSDRFALALNFFWNDFNLFEAETYLMNLQFPAKYLEPKEGSITMVNLPFHEFFIALFMKFFGTKDPIVFRIYQLAWSIIGLNALLKIAKKLKLTTIASTVLIVFVATTPLFVYYQDNFLPSISSFSLCLLAINCYLTYYSKNKVSYFYLSIFLFILAGVYRNTFIIQLIALLGLEFLRFIKGNAKLLHVSLAAIAVGVVFYLQNIFQMSQVNDYGSVFQYYLTPPKNWDHVISITNRIFDRWIFEYFSIAHYLFMGSLLLAVFLIRLLVSKAKKHKHQQIIIDASLIYPLGALFGCFLFYLAMYPKLYDHDYYIMDTLYIPVILLLLFFLKTVQQYLKKPIALSLLIVFSIPAIILAKNNLNQRRTSPAWEYSYETINDLKGIEATLDSLNIDQTKKVLTIGSSYSNLPFILMNRKGFIVNPSNKLALKDILQWNYDVILIHDRLYKEFYYSSYPELLGKVKKVYSNGFYTICIPEQQSKTPTLIEFFNTGLNELLYQQTIDFETKKVHFWNHINRTDQDKYSGNFSGLIQSDHLYSLSFKSNTLPLNKGNGHLVNVAMKVKSTDNLRNLNLVVDVNDSGERIFYQLSNLKLLYTQQNDWQEINLQYSIPNTVSNEAKLSIYFWNPGKQQAFIDDFTLSIY